MVGLPGCYLGTKGVGTTESEHNPWWLKLLRVQTSAFLVLNRIQLWIHRKPMAPTESEHDPWFVGVIGLAENWVFWCSGQSGKGCLKGWSDWSDMNLVTPWRESKVMLSGRILERCSRPWVSSWSDHKRSLRPQTPETMTALSNKTKIQSSKWWLVQMKLSENLRNGGKTITHCVTCLICNVPIHTILKQLCTYYYYSSYLLISLVLTWLLSYPAVYCMQFLHHFTWTS
jgi:hypothetical protein